MSEKKPEYLISACLCGVPCRYDGSPGKTDPALLKLHQEGRAVLVCPESLGGLKIPRPPAEIINGKVIDKTGRDVSAEFTKGAERVLAVAKKHNVAIAILKERSPSCGSSMIYDGTFSKKLIPGQGVTTRLLQEHGIVVFSEENYQEAGIEKSQPEQAP